MLQKSQTMKMKKLADEVESCHITTPPEDLSKLIELNNKLNQRLVDKWPKPKMNVPTIFLHKTVDFARHCEPLLSLGVAFYQPYLGTNYTRIVCYTIDDHKAMLQYFKSNFLPFHTFGFPNEKKMKVIIRGLPKDTDLDIFSEALKAAGIPVVRVHKMHMKEFAKNRDIVALVVVPHNDEGKKLLKLKKAFDRDVTIEPPITKLRQCHRCQKWGHSERYCHGAVKCVKCAGDHLTSKCAREPDSKEPPTCANCGGNHTANYRECFYCPESTEYKNNKQKKINRTVTGPSEKRVLVTMENHDKLYRKIKNIPKHNEAVPF